MREVAPTYCEVSWGGRQRAIVCYAILKSPGYQGHEPGWIKRLPMKKDLCVAMPD